jgi:PKD repeat protein
MKIKFTLFVSLLLNVFFTRAQITLTTTDMPTAGWTQVIAKDTPVTSINYGLAGANRVWNFSNLTRTNSDSVHYLAPTNTQLSQFPNATLAETVDGISFVMAKNSSSKFDAEGLQGVLAGNVTYANFSPVEDLYHFPTQYGGNFSGSWGFQNTVPGSSVGQPVYAVRLTYTDTYYDTIDGWGKTTTPVGTYNSLREKRKDYTETLIEYELFSFSSWTQLSDTKDTTVEYNYLAKETKGPVVSFDYDSAGNVKDAKYSLVPATPIAHFTWAAGGGGLINFTDSSSNSPTTYSWTFGDGQNGTGPNPAHTYAANGTYYVCETVSNSSGSNTYCDSVHVTAISSGHQPPVANNDSATVLQAVKDTLNVTVNDYSPSADAFCITSVYPTQWFTASGCNDLIFTPDSNFVGKDTCWYIICNTGQPTLCDTAMVVVTVNVNGALYPEAGYDTATVLQATSAAINISSVSSDPVGSYCVTSLTGSPNASFFSIDGSNCQKIDFTPDSTFTGKDTCWYVICDNGHNTWCDTGMLVVTVVPNPALLPLVAFSGSFDSQPCLVTFLNPYGNATLINGSSSDSVLWQLHPVDCTDSTFSFSSDTVTFNIDQLWGNGGHCWGFTKLEICLTAYNKFGSNSMCDTGCVFQWEGIKEEELSSINIYPNPAGNLLTIDMRKNTDEITADYSAIEIYNAIGEKLKALPRDGQVRIANIPVAELTQGLYLVTIVDSKGVRRTLGKFTKE